MLNLLLALSLGVIIGWSFHAFYNELSTPNIIRNDINISIDKSIKSTSLAKTGTQKTPIAEQKEQNISQQEIVNRRERVDNFYRLLNRGLFSDAMALYLEAPEKKLTLYRLKLLDYFQKKSKTNTPLAIIEMYEFIELEPEHKDIAKLLIETLNSSKNYHQLVTFLEEQIARGSSPALYIYRLAEYYVEVENYSRAIELLKEIEFDENFTDRAKELLKQIEKKVEEVKEYTYTIPLKKSGEHFTVDVLVNNTPLTLLLDTGATLTMINEEKLSYLPIVKENIALQTAGGEIDAQLKEAERLSIGELELQGFQLISFPFQQKNADGLLGMNFFKKFKFKIDQENKILYLSQKE